MTAPTRVHVSSFCCELSPCCSGNHPKLTRALQRHFLLSWLLKTPQQQSLQVS